MFIKIGVKKIVRGAQPSYKPLRGGLGFPRPPPGLPPSGPCRFWIKSPKPSDYRVSLVSVSESGSQKSLEPHFPKNFEYKINYLSKNKNRKIVFS